MGSVMFFEGESIEEVRKVVEADPYFTDGVVRACDSQIIPHPTLTPLAIVGQREAYNSPFCASDALAIEVDVTSPRICLSRASSRRNSVYVFCTQGLGLHSLLLLFLLNNGAANNFRMTRSAAICLTSKCQWHGARFLYYTSLSALASKNSLASLDCDWRPREISCPLTLRTCPYIDCILPPNFHFASSDQPWSSRSSHQVDVNRTLGIHPA